MLKHNTPVQFNLAKPQHFLPVQVWKCLPKPYSATHIVVWHAAESHEIIKLVNYQCFVPVLGKYALLLGSICCIACRDELDEIIKLVKPQHFLPVHGEYAFLNTHAQLAHEAGIRHTSVIRNGQMLGVHHRRNGNEVSTTGASAKGMQLLGEVKLRMLYNDGNKVCACSHPASHQHALRRHHHKTGSWTKSALMVVQLLVLKAAMFGCWQLQQKFQVKGSSHIP